MTLHATARARALVHGIAIVAVLVVAGTGFLVVDKLGEARRCHHLTSKAAAARYGCPTTPGAATAGEDVAAPGASPTHAATAPRRAPVASRTRRLDPTSSGTHPLAWADTAKARAVAECESGGDIHAVSASGTYRGKWQMDADFWRTYGGLRYATRADLATEPEQDRVAHNGWLTRGWQPWTCG